MKPKTTRRVRWENLHDNEVLKMKDFYISYNPDTNASKAGLGAAWNSFGSLIGVLVRKELEDDGRAETALVKISSKGNTFYILNGDFRKEYEKLALKGFAACLKFYKSKPQFRSNWSTDI